jgi:hypothetical protein
MASRPASGLPFGDRSVIVLVRRYINHVVLPTKPCGDAPVLATATVVSIASFVAWIFFTGCTVICKLPAFSWVLKESAFWPVTLC